MGLTIVVRTRPLPNDALQDLDESLDTLDETGALAWHPIGEDFLRTVAAGGAR